MSKSATEMDNETQKKRHREMTHLQRYLKLKKITIADIQISTGIGYSTLHKTIGGFRSARHVKEAIANYLKLPYSHVWGVSSSKHLVKLINVEINQRAEAERIRLRSRFLNGKNSLPNTQAVSNG